MHAPFSKMTLTENILQQKDMNTSLWNITIFSPKCFVIFKDILTSAILGFRFNNYITVKKMVEKFILTDTIFMRISIDLKHNTIAPEPTVSEYNLK